MLQGLQQLRAGRIAMEVFFEQIGHRLLSTTRSFGKFILFCRQTASWTAQEGVSRRNIQLLVPQLYEVGNRSVAVIMVTGLFVGLVLAVQAYAQLAAMDLDDRLGVLVNLSLVKELGPVLAGVMLAGRVGGALVAELGTMNVTEQLDALRSMGSDPVRRLVVPRVMACVLLAPALTVFCNLLGAIGSGFIAIELYGVASEPFWYYTSEGIYAWDVATGFLKSVFFGGLIALIACYKGFHCRAGAEGVGRACTEAFVASFIAILVVDFFLGVLLQAIHEAIWGFQALI
jgi:phospholipid/cholesterol/gamma-HCH transport system permease protein